MAFSGPQGATRYYCGFKAKQPEDYWQYFKRRGVNAVVRLNNKASLALRADLASRCMLEPPSSSRGRACRAPLPVITSAPPGRVTPARLPPDAPARVQLYESSRFTDGGFRHHELYFPDGSCPSDQILQRFLDISEQETGAPAWATCQPCGRASRALCWLAEAAAWPALLLWWTAG